MKLKNSIPHCAIFSIFYFAEVFVPRTERYKISHTIPVTISSYVHMWVLSGCVHFELYLSGLIVPYTGIYPERL